MDYSRDVAIPAVSAEYPVRRSQPRGLGKARSNTVRRAIRRGDGSKSRLRYVDRRRSPPTIAYGALRANTRMVAQVRVADGERRRSRVRRGGLILRYLVVEGYCELAV